MILPQARRDEIGAAIQGARLYRPSTARGRTRLAAALLHIDQALALAGSRTDIPIALPANVLDALQRPRSVSEGQYINSMVFVASAMRRAVSEMA
jgi:hypothetical protein